MADTIFPNDLNYEINNLTSKLSTKFTTQSPTPMNSSSPESLFTNHGVNLRMQRTGNVCTLRLQCETFVNDCLSGYIIARINTHDYPQYLPGAFCFGTYFYKTGETETGTAIYSEAKPFKLESEDINVENPTTHETEKWSLGTARTYEKIPGGTQKFYGYVVYIANKMLDDEVQT